MKILGRTIIILVAFALLMGMTYLAVNAGSSAAASTAPASERGRRVPENASF